MFPTVRVISTLTYNSLRPRGLPAMPVPPGEWRSGMANILDRFRLDGKTALVTGAASGLGQAIAVALAEAGARVACHGNRRTATYTVEMIQGRGDTALAFNADLAEVRGASDLFEQVSAAMGVPEILVNNAGMIHRDVAETHGFEEWVTTLQVNLNSAFVLCQLAGREMLRKRQGKIINVASLLSFQGRIRVAAYAASKGGLAQMTKALANEWAGRNVQVNAIAPGYFRTDNTEALQKDEVRNQQI